VIDVPAFAPHQHMQASIAAAAPLAGQLDQAALELIVQRLGRPLVMQHGA
jgi:hypothetical protein